MARRRTTTLREATAALDTIAPPALAQSWDHVGLLAGDPAAPCRRMLLCIDLMPAVLDEARTARADLILAYHPPIFHPIQRLIAGTAGVEALVHDAIAAGMAIYSPHTALDAAPGGTNDVIADICGLSEVGPFEYVSTAGRQLKLVTFVPHERLEGLASALFAAGAGRIGDYQQCSYRLRGEGTFFGTAGTDPKVGQRGRLERVEETRIEVVVPERRLPEVVTALRAAHPYEEPAFDLYPLAGEPVPGIGRVGKLPAGTTLASLARLLRKRTASRVLSVIGEPGRTLRSAAVCVGAAGRLPLEKPYSAGCDLVVTGEIRHHDALTLLRHGKTAIALGHWESERPVLKPLARRIVEALPGVAVVVSRRDTSPFAPV